MFQQFELVGVSVWGPGGCSCGGGGGGGEMAKEEGEGGGSADEAGEENERKNLRNVTWFKEKPKIK